MSSLRTLLLPLATMVVLSGLSDVSLAQKGGGKTTTPKLSLTVSPSAILEGNTTTGTVTHNNSNTSLAVTVTLSSSDTSEATIPASVTIPAGASSATFTVTAVNDSTADGDQSVTLSASATGYASASAVITVSDKPIFEYRTEVISGGASSISQVNGITNNSRVYGWMWRPDGYKSGYVYDQVPGTMYELNQIPELTAQVDTLAGLEFGLASIVGMNESGLMTGYIEDGVGNRLGIAIDPTVDGQFSPDPADWVIQLLPDLGSTYTYGKRINESGDILGVFQRPDGAFGAYIHNPWDGGTPAVLPVTLSGGVPVELNDFAQVAGVDDVRRAFLYDALTGSTQYFTDADYVSVKGLNNAGVFSGQARISVPATRGKGTTTTTIAFRHDGTFHPIAGTVAAAHAMSLNESGDVACFAESSWNSMLSHTGFTPNPTEQLFSLSRAIAADDPLKAEFVNLQPAVYAINDRDATGYPQLVCRVGIPNSSGGTTHVAVILTPSLVP